MYEQHCYSVRKSSEMQLYACLNSVKEDKEPFQMTHNPPLIQ